MTTGSGIERALECRASSVLPHVHTVGGAHATFGTESHAHLERIAGGMSAADSLALVDDEHRLAVAGIDLDDLRGDLMLSSEVALAYNVVTDTARVLGQSLGRAYDVTPDEIAMTLDLVGVTDDAVIVKDFKTGWSKRTPAARNGQMRGGALAAARAFKRDAARTELVYLRDGRPAYRDRAEMAAIDLAAFAAELRAMHERIRADRVRYAAGEHITPREGDHCKYCPAAWSCPAKTAILRQALATDDNLPVTAADAGTLWERIGEAEKALKAAKSKLIALASHEPLLVRVDDDGTEHWLGKHATNGNEKLDAAIALEEAAAVIAPSDEAAFVREVADLDVTKAALTRAIKARGLPAGKTLDTIIARVRARGGATRGTRETIGIYTHKDPT